jgi:hypothetical protein
MMIELRQNTVAFFETKSGSIIGSFILAVALVGGAYFLSSAHISSVNAASTDDALRAYATQDSDGDGLPDWEEALFGTDPHKTDSKNLGMTDAQAVQSGKIALKVGQNASSTPSAGESLASTIPGQQAATSSMTAQFAQAFFNNYISTRGSRPPTQAEAQQFVQGAVANLVQSGIRPDVYTASSMHISGSGSASLQAYAAAMDQVLSSHSAAVAYDEITYFSDAAQKNDKSAVASLKAISSAYVSTAQAAATVSVPNEAAQAHLAFVNSMSRLGTTIDDLSGVQGDPIRALVALGNYTPDGSAFIKSLQAFGPVFAQDNLVITTGPGSRFYALVQYAQNATTTP